MKFTQATTATTLAFAVAAKGISAAPPDMDAAAVQRCISQSCGRVQAPEPLEGCWERCMDVQQEKERSERMQQQGGHGRRRGMHLPERRQLTTWQPDYDSGWKAAEARRLDAEAAASKKKAHKQEIAAVLDSLGLEEVDEPESEKRDLGDGYEEELEASDETEPVHTDEDGTRLPKGTKAS